MSWDMTGSGIIYGLPSMASGVWSREVSRACAFGGLVYGLSPLSTDLSSGNGPRVCPSSHEPSLAMTDSLQSPINQENFHSSSRVLIDLLAFAYALVFILLVTSLEDSSVKLEDRHLLHLLAAPHPTPLSSSLPYHMLLNRI